MTFVMFCSFLLCWILWDMTPVLYLCSNKSEVSTRTGTRKSLGYEPLKGRARDSP